MEVEIAKDSNKTKADYEKRYLDYLKQLAEKKSKEAEENEKERIREAESRERLKRVVLARAEKFRQIESAKKYSSCQRPVRMVEENDKKKSIKIPKMTKRYRPRYASLLNELANSVKAKKEEQENKLKHIEDNHKRLKSKMGIDKTKARIFQPITKPLTANETKENKSFISKHESLLPAIETNTHSEHRKTSHPITAFAAHKKQKIEETINPEEKRRIAREAANMILHKQQEYLKKMAKKKVMKQKQEEMEKEQKSKVISKLIEKAKTQIHELYENYHKEEVRSESKPQKIITKYEADKVVESFLARNKAVKKKEFDTADFDLWRRRNKVNKDTKVFIVTGGYADIKRALRDRGWVENKKWDSVCFDLKWTIGTKEIDYKSLKASQIANHFDNNGAITTKVGLCHRLRDLIWHNNVDVNTFYPHCFDLLDTIDAEGFMEEFKNVKAESVLKEYVVNGEFGKVTEEQVVVSLNICERRLRDINEILDDKVGIEFISKEEWEVVNSELDVDNVKRRRREGWFKKLLKKYQRPKKHSKKAKKKMDEEECKAYEKKVIESNKLLLEKVKEVLEEMKKKYPQFMLNGYHNAWIVKPADMSRGRGIKIFNNLAEILEYGREHQYIVQKYIENPMIIKRRKFDIRQWVLVTNFCPLAIWFYEECYIRFGAADYKIDEINNRFIHLTNNSVTKHYEGQDEAIEGNMWDQETFKEHLKVL